jgi:hypothetical protein
MKLPSHPKRLRKTARSEVQWIRDGYIISDDYEMSTTLVVATANGETLFRYFDETEQFFGPASISNGVIYVGSYAEDAGRLFAFGL